MVAVILAILGIAVVLMLAILACIDPLIGFLGANDEVYGYCYDYLLYSLPFVALCMLEHAVPMFLVAAGKPGLSLVLTLVGGVLNIVLDYLFLAVLGTGIAGAAIATGIGYAVPALGAMAYFVWARPRMRAGSIDAAGAPGGLAHPLYLVRPNFNAAFNLRTLRRSAAIGSPELIIQLSSALTTWIINLQMMSLQGPDAVAAVTIVLYAQFLFISVHLGYCTGTGPIYSYKLGQEDWRGLNRVYSMSLRFIICASVVMFAASLLGARPIVSIFTDGGTAVFNLAVHGMILFAPSFLLIGVNIFAANLFVALHDGKNASIVSVLRTLVFLAGFLLLLPLFMGIDGVWLAIPAAEGATLVVTIVLLRRLGPRLGYAGRPV
jgi:Na+-driven multidrug efflux pump